MIFKQTWLNAADNTNINWVQTFQLYKGFKRKSTSLGSFIKGSARMVEPPRIEYKGFKYKFNKKGDICRGIVVKTVYILKKKDGLNLKYYYNSIIMIRKNQDIKSKYLFGVLPSFIKRKKLKTLYKKIV